MGLVDVGKVKIVEEPCRILDGIPTRLGRCNARSLDARSIGVPCGPALEPLIIMTSLDRDQL